MSDAFRSSDEFDEQAHQLYNEGRYEEAVQLLREGTSVYPHVVELHVGLAYAHLAREDFAWARESFAAALGLDPDHEDALAGFGETRLRLGDRTGALRAFERIVQLGFGDDHDLMLQIGRALFRESLFPAAHRFFELAVQADAASPDAAAALGYSSHRLNQDGAAFYWLRRALAMEPRQAEARIYLANLLYDRGETDAALHQLERTSPDDHFDELGIWRLIELRKTAYRLQDDDPEFAPWFERLDALAGDADPVDQLLAEVAALLPDGSTRDPNQLELFGALARDPHAMQRKLAPEVHLVETVVGAAYRGSWEEIVQQMKAADATWRDAPLSAFMVNHARLGQAETGVIIPVTDAEAFLRGSAAAGAVRIVH